MKRGTGTSGNYIDAVGRGMGYPIVGGGGGNGVRIHKRPLLVTAQASEKRKKGPLQTERLKKIADSPQQKESYRTKRRDPKKGDSMNGGVLTKKKTREDAVWKGGSLLNRRKHHGTAHAGHREKDRGGRRCKGTLTTSALGPRNRGGEGGGADWG